jgi:hypothetical protein
MSSHAVRYANVPAPSRKNGRRSSKNCSKALRLSTAGSASTWPKSGLTVASSVMFEARPIFASAPRASCCGCRKPVAPTPVRACVTFFVTTYGATSTRRGGVSPSIPDTAPACDTYPCRSRR